MCFYLGGWNSLRNLQAQYWSFLKARNTKKKEKKKETGTCEPQALDAAGGKGYFFQKMSPCFP